jgi:hypothetical protein
VSTANAPSKAVCCHVLPAACCACPPAKHPHAASRPRPPPPPAIAQPLDPGCCASFIASEPAGCGAAYAMLYASRSMHPAEIYWGLESAAGGGVRIFLEVRWAGGSPPLLPAAAGGACPVRCAGSAAPLGFGRAGGGCLRRSGGLLGWLLQCPAWRAHGTSQPCPCALLPCTPPPLEHRLAGAACGGTWEQQQPAARGRTECCRCWAARMRRRRWCGSCCRWAA